MEIVHLLRSLDIWHCALVKVPASELRQSDLSAEKLVWLPPTGDKFTFRADPFGIWESGKLHVFVERFDYRVLKGEIEVLIFDLDLNFLESHVVLRRPWHLSYPIVFRDGSDICMLPEASRSGELLIYRARSFPTSWDAAKLIGVPGNAVDATPFVHEGRWCLIYGLVSKDRNRTCSLNAAFADRVTGPFRNCSLNPLRTGLSGTRPAGAPILRDDGVILLPVQDSSKTYGGAVRRLKILKLDDEQFEAADEAWLAPSAALSPFDRGLHTISSASGLSLIDCKFVDRSFSGTLAFRKGKAARKCRDRAVCAFVDLKG